MSKEIYVTDKHMIQALTIAEKLLEKTDYRMGDKEIEFLTLLYKSELL